MEHEHVELLIRIDERTKAMDDKVDGINKRLDNLNGTVKDNTKRIFILENWRWYIIGIATAIGVGVSLLFQFKIL